MGLINTGFCKANIIVTRTPVFDSPALIGQGTIGILLHPLPYVSLHGLTHL